MLDYAGTGMSVGEISHRSKAFTDLLSKAEADLRTLLSIPSSHRVLFMAGGGTGQFAAVPLNLFPGGECTYVVSGTWSKAAATEAAKYATVKEVSDWRSFRQASTRFVYVCTNETVNGVLFDPVAHVQSDQELIADMSSEILTRQIDVARYGLIFAGAQKNIGIAGVTVVIVRESLLGAPSKQCPIILDYTVTAKNGSLYNTPPTTAIYTAGLVFQWALQQGGLTELERTTKHKAGLLYDALKRHASVFKILVDEPFRSNTNIVFKTGSEASDKKFVEQAEKEGLVGLAGHRSVGGIRASFYNAVSLQNVERLVEFVERFAKQE